MEIKFKVNRTVRKSNRLINYRDKLGLTALQQKLFLFSVTELKRKEDFGTLLSFDMRDFFGKQRLTTRDYEAVRKAAAQLVRTSISIRDDKGKWIELSLYSKIEGQSGSSVVHFKFNQELQPYLVNLRGNFTSYLYDNVVHFKSGYSVRIYELLVRRLGWQNVYEVKVDYLKEILGITETKTYQTFPKFRKKVLDKAQEEINAYSNLNISYETVKRGRSIHSIRFFIQAKERTDDDGAMPLKADQLPASNGHPYESGAAKQEMGTNQLVEDQAEKIARLIVRLKSYGFSHQQALKTLEVTGATVESGIWKLLYDLNLMVMDKRVSNPKSYLAKVLKDKYKLDLTEVVNIKN